MHLARFILFAGVERVIDTLQRQMLAAAAVSFAVCSFEDHIEAIALLNWHRAANRADAEDVIQHVLTNLQDVAAAVRHLGAAGFQQHRAIGELPT